MNRFAKTTILTVASLAAIAAPLASASADSWGRRHHHGSGDAVAAGREPFAAAAVAPVRPVRAVLSDRLAQQAHLQAALGKPDVGVGLKVQGQGRLEQDRASKNGRQRDLQKGPSFLSATHDRQDLVVAFIEQPGDVWQPASRRLCLYCKGNQ